jgi:5'-nucleotidase/UDP-sugar diphosphatase
MFKASLTFLLLITLSTCLFSQQFLILHTNDHHGHVFSHTIRENYIVPGLAERAYIIQTLTYDIENFLLLDAGDINHGQFVSNISEAEPDIVAYNLIGYHAMAIGNHELSHGFKRLQRQIAWADFPFLSANVFL